jgi:PleD family two-component response regulator
MKICAHPVTVLSSSDGSTQTEALAWGMILAKPVDPSELALRLRNTLSQRRPSGIPDHDALTGLPTKRAYVREADRAVKLRL